jgi:hypothetical protein
MFPEKSALRCSAQIGGQGTSTDPDSSIDVAVPAPVDGAVDVAAPAPVDGALVFVFA